MTEHELRTAELIRAQISELEKLQLLLESATDDRRIGITINVSGNNYGYYNEQSRRMREMTLRLINRLLKSKWQGLSRLIGEDNEISASPYQNRDWQFMRIKMNGSGHSFTRCIFNHSLVSNWKDDIQMDKCEADYLRFVYDVSQPIEIRRAVITDTSFTHLYLKNGLIAESSFNGCDFTRSFLNGLNAESSSFNNCNFNASMLINARLGDTDLTGTTWTDANLQGAEISSQWQELIESFEFVGTPTWL